MDNEEEWRDIPGYEGLYQVSDYGQVRSLPRRNAKGGVLKPSIHNTYYDAQLFIGGKWKRARVHSLVMLAFVGPRPDGYHVDHINCNRLDNRLCNLRYLPASVNSGQGAAHKNKIYRYHRYGEKNSYSKLTDEQRCEIVELYLAGGYTQQQIADRYGICRQTVGDYVNGRRGAPVVWDASGRAALRDAGADDARGGSRSGEGR